MMERSALNHELINLLKQTINSKSSEFVFEVIKKVNLTLEEEELNWIEVFKPNLFGKSPKYRDEPSTLADARAFRLSFGKYRHMALGEIEKLDYQYLQWLATQDLRKDPLVKGHIEKILSVEF
jgi:hypothetical protein